MSIRAMTILGLLGLALLPAAGSAQDESQRRSELGERQRLVERNMAELEAQFVRVAESLQAKEPERAKRLIDALQQAKQQLIAKRMSDITGLLDANKYDDADHELTQVVEDLDQLVKLLLNSNTNEMSKKEELEALERWKEQLTAIKREQTQQTRETSKIANKEQTLKDLDAKIAQVKELITQQNDVINQTGNAKGGIRELDRVADAQFEVRKKTEAVARDLALPDTSNEKDNQNSADDNSSEPADGKQPSQPPAENPNNPSKSKNSNSSPSNSQSNPSQSNPSQSNPSQSNENQPSNSDSSKSPKQPGQRPLENAAQNQQQAEEKLTQAKPAERNVLRKRRSMT